NGGLVDLRVCRWDGDFLASSSVGRSRTLTGGIGPPGRSRKLTLVVSPQEVSLSWDGQPIATVLVTQLNHQPWLAGGITAVPWENIRSGGLGVYLYRAAGSIQQVELRHEPV